VSIRDSSRVCEKGGSRRANKYGPSQPLGPYGARMSFSPASLLPKQQSECPLLPLGSVRLRARSASQPTRSHPEDPRLSSALWADSLRRPQRPGNPVRLSAISGTSQQFTLENCRGDPLVLHDVPARRSRHSRLRECNVPQPPRALKRKLRLLCAETVEDQELLWKAQEKRFFTLHPAGSASRRGNSR
jgi:hypothetical protein